MLDTRVLQPSRVRYSESVPVAMSDETVKETFEEVTKWGDDPVEFLAAMQKEYPPLASILTTKQVKLLAKSPKDPYPAGKTDVNEEFISDMIAYYRALVGSKEIKDNLQSELVAPVTSDKSVLVEESKAPILVLKKVSSRIDDLVRVYMVCAG